MSDKWMSPGVSFILYTHHSLQQSEASITHYVSFTKKEKEKQTWHLNVLLLSLSSVSSLRPYQGTNSLSSTSPRPRESDEVEGG